MLHQWWEQLWLHRAGSTAEAQTTDYKSTSSRWVCEQGSCEFFDLSGEGCDAPQRRLMVGLEVWMACLATYYCCCRSLASHRRFPDVPGDLG